LTKRGGRPDQVLRASVTLTGWLPGREQDVVEALERIDPERPPGEPGPLPLVAMEGIPKEEAERVKELLESAGGTVSVEEVWVTRERSLDDRPRPTCPACGSAHTQPFTHAGPAARVNMKCTDCGHLFRSAASRR
jgi:hypothetical protein